MARKGLRGSKEKRGENRYRLTIYTGRKLSDGTYERYRETFHGTEDEADDRMLELLYKMGRNQLPKSGTLTFGQYLERWFSDYVEVQCEPETIQHYRSMLDSRIIPKLGTITLATLGLSDLDHFFAQLQKDGARLDGKPGPLSPASIRKIHTLLNSALNYAVERQFIPFNPVSGVRLPAVQKAERRTWTPEQLGTFLEVVEESPHKALVWTLLFTGCRSGEALALKWDDVDFAEGEIRFDESVRKARKHKGPIGKTKNKKPRVVPMDDRLATVLKEHKAKQNETVLKSGGTWNRDGLVFPSQEGTPLFRDNVDDRIWYPLIEAAGVPRITLHEARHTFGTIAADSGVDAKALSQILGHHSVAFTMDWYYHPGKKQRKKAVSMFSARIQGRG